MNLRIMQFSPSVSSSLLYPLRPILEPLSSVLGVFRSFYPTVLTVPGTVLSKDTELTFVWLLALRSAAVCSLQVGTDWGVP
jgi:hypothetical protein